MSNFFRVACLMVAAFALAFPEAGAAQTSPKTVALRDLVSPNDPLAQQDLTFDTTFAQLANQYFSSPDAAVLNQLAQSAAAHHLLDHARNFDYNVSKDSTQSLVAHLLHPSPHRAAQTKVCQGSLDYFTTHMLADPHWVNDTLRYLPADFRFHGSLFLIFGYDIGVAFGPSASLNCSHRHFAKHRSELLYYAIHELHHVGFMSYQPPPRLSDIKTCRQLLQLVEYSTQMEGMAVWAAYARRDQEHALADDDDYVALQDEPHMQHDESLYFTDLHYLEQRGDAIADADAWAVIDRMSSGERLWYRVGARMAQRIEQAAGRPALVGLIKTGPESFVEKYRQLTHNSPVGAGTTASDPNWLTAN